MDRKETFTTRRKEIKRIIEALLFSTNEPLSFEKMKEIVEIDYPTNRLELQTILKGMHEEYEKNENAFQIVELGGGYMLRTIKEMHPYLAKLHQNRRGEKISKSGATVLAIIAYKEPITRSEIEKIRGVDSSGILHTLLERELIEVVGKLEAPGRPSQYGVTQKFLTHFGLKSRDELKLSLTP